MKLTDRVAVSAANLDGVNTAATVQLARGARLKGGALHVPPGANEKSGDVLSAMAVMDAATFWLFLTVMVLGALDVPSPTVPKATVEVTVTGAIPVPLRDMAWGLLEALSVTVTVADRLPSGEGVNATVMVQLFPAASVEGVSGQVPPSVKSPAFGPLRAMLLIVSGVLCVFLSVAPDLFAVSPTTWLPNERDAVSVTCA